MKTPLDELLDSMDPDRIIEITESRVNETLNSFPLRVGSLNRWEDFKTCMMQFICHADYVILRLRTPRSVNTDFDWDRARRLLHRHYGHEGEKTAFELARTGIEGGLYAVLKALAWRISEEYTDNEINARVATFLNHYEPKEWLALAEEYLQKYGHLLPSELTEGSAARIKVNFSKYLQEHPKLLQRLRRVGR